VVVDRGKKPPTEVGLNAATGAYVHLLDAAITDPGTVTRSASENAASIAGLFLTTEAVIADRPEPVAPAAPTGGLDPLGGMGSTLYGWCLSCLRIARSSAHPRSHRPGVSALTDQMHLFSRASAPDKMFQ